MQICQNKSTKLNLVSFFRKHIYDIITNFNYLINDENYLKSSQMIRVLHNSYQIIKY